MSEQLDVRGSDALREIMAEAAVGDHLLAILEDLSAVGGLIEKTEETRILFSFFGIQLAITAQGEEIVCNSPLPEDREQYVVIRVDIVKKAVMDFLPDEAVIDTPEEKPHAPSPYDNPYDNSGLYL